MVQKFIVLKKALGERIKRLAGERNISLSNLEMQAGYSLGIITRWTNASDTENFEIFSKLVTIASILGVSIDELLGARGPQTKIPHAEEMDFVSCMTVSTEEKKLRWVEKNWRTIEELLPKQPLGPEDHTPAGVWSAEHGRLRFLFIAYCDDPDDAEEPMSFRLYALAGHGIPPQSIQAEITALQALYMIIQLQAAYQLFVSDTVERVPFTEA